MLIQGLIFFAARVCEGRTRPCHFGVGYCPEVGVLGVVRDVSFCSKGYIDWVTIDDVYIEAALKCVVEDV